MLVSELKRRLDFLNPSSQVVVVESLNDGPYHRDLEIVGQPWQWSELTVRIQIREIRNEGTHG
jgi:hypothetical protein